MEAALAQKNTSMARTAVADLHALLARAQTDRKNMKADAGHAYPVSPHLVGPLAQSAPWAGFQAALAAIVLSALTFGCI